ncbi:TPA: hypothetical protein EYP70_02610 [Candidatus Bathyarchaeota archaeon]|nr:hypothetical protein [Candidatus Bathyarchaeota archaeon]
METFLSIKKVRINTFPKDTRTYIVECERYSATLKEYLLTFEALEKYGNAQEKQEIDKEKPLKSLNLAIFAIEEALDIHESMMLNIEETKSHYLIPQAMRDLTFMREFLVRLLDQLKDRKREVC